jgi:N-acylglucosamine-6-phosphate 2-epimerase
MRFRNLAALDARLSCGLVVSCQPVDDGPMDRDEMVVSLAAAAIAGGAMAVRIERASRVAKVRVVIDAPIIGIVKRDLADSPVRITPFVQDVDDLIVAGADVIAVDATRRARPAAVATLLAAIRRGGALAMADCSTYEEAIAAHALGFDLIGTTLSGYTGGDVPDEPDYALLTRLRSQVPRVMAEGRFNTPAQVAEARRCGAWAVTVGTAITRTEVITGWFAAALRAG